MQNINQFNSKINFLLTDIDDTLTDHGQLQATAYQALWNLKNSNVKIIPVTGRPAGWCEMIARLWPIDGVIGENGGFYFRYIDKVMKRHFVFDSKTMLKNKEKLKIIETEVLNTIPGSALASDQFCRIMDLAIDFCEDVPALPKDQINKIVSIFEKHGAQAKISSIHVNGWFGNYNKVTQALFFLKNEFQLTETQIQNECAFIGDSPNDEPMFQWLQNSIAVANINPFLEQLKFKPKFICNHNGGNGFKELSDLIINNRNI